MKVFKQLLTFFKVCRSIKYNIREQGQLYYKALRIRNLWKGKDFVVSKCLFYRQSLTLACTNTLIYGGIYYTLQICNVLIIQAPELSPLLCNP
jgi:hypothetical protein